MIRTQVYLPDELEKELKLLAASEGVSYSQLIREGVGAVISKRKALRKRKFNPWKDFVGKSEGGPKDLSARHDDYLYTLVKRRK